MPKLVLDSGALIGVERGDIGVAATIKRALRDEFDLKTTAAVLAEVWRDDAGRQVTLGKFLRGVDIEDVDEEAGRKAGVLIGRAGQGDAVDALVVASASPGDRILTSDPGDLRPLATVSRRGIFVVPC